MTVLLNQVKRLHQSVIHLAELFATLENPLITHIVARMDDLEKTVETLPTDKDALRWWLWHSQAHKLRNLLTPVQGYARLIHMQPAQLGRESYTEQENAQFERVNDVANTFNETLTDLADEMRALYRAEAETPPQAMHLSVALERVWPILDYTLHDTAVRLFPQIDAELPTVLYHPLHTTALIQHLIFVISHEWMNYGPLTISTYPEVNSLALSIGARGLHLSEEQWHSVFKTEAESVYYKRLIAIGGTLDPLTSQATQEAGFMLRLPWATSTTHIKA